MQYIHDTESSESYPNETDIEDQAARWLARWNSYEMSEAEFDAFEQWKSADPAHLEMFEDMRKVWAEMGLITNIIPEDVLEKDRDPDILAKTLKQLISYSTTPRIVAFIISAAAIFVLVG